MSKKAQLKGMLFIPGDKSISHRALIFSALARGTMRVSGLSPAQDCHSTIKCLRRLGITVKTPQQAGRSSAAISQTIDIDSPGLDGLARPAFTLDAGNSGTTMRLLSGLVAGRPFTTQLDGDDSLRQRPMRRVLNPLQLMGAQIKYESPNQDEPARDGRAPFSVTGGKLTGRDFDLSVASAQVQTAILLAGLQADGVTQVKTPAAVRDHTERMFRFMSVPFGKLSNGTIYVKRLTEPVAPFVTSIPGDMSSAAFFMVAAACLPGSDILLKNVGLNPGRRLVLDVLQKMGAEIELETERDVSFEPVADLRIRGGARLKGVEITEDTIAAGIDEIPILALAGALCQGTFTVRGASELRLKESDRLTAIVNNLRDAGSTVEETDDGFIILGKEELKGGSVWRTHHDHRLAMTGMIACLLCSTPVEVEETASIGISYPGFKEHLEYLSNVSNDTASVP